MTLKPSAIGMIATLLFCGIGATIGSAQGPMTDRANVNIPYKVTLGDITLPPGNYTIEELSSNQRTRVLLIYGQKGKKYKTAVLTIPTLDNQTPDETKLMLHHFGNDYYFDRLWIAGKNYGYKFVAPENIQGRQQEMTVAMTGTYTAPPVAEAAPPPPPPEVEPVPEEAPPEEAPAPEANRETPPAPEMPKTASDWTIMLIGGAGLSLLGLLLSRSVRHNQV
jgi:hypothetical protein